MRVGGASDLRRQLPQYKFPVRRLKMRQCMEKSAYESLVDAFKDLFSKKKSRKQKSSFTPLFGYLGPSGFEKR